jgi:hypothetical protein
MKKKIPTPLERRLKNMPEKELHQYFYDNLIGDFYMIHEVEGRCNLNHPAIPDPIVIADFLMYPRQHLLDEGFADTWFAVEIKTAINHWAEALRQAFWYTVSTFRVKDRLIVPGFAAGWVPCHYFEGGSSIQSGERAAFAYMNVGTFEIEGKYTEWELYMGTGSSYARKYSPHCHFNPSGYKVNQQRKSFWIKAGSQGKYCSHTGIDGVPA